MMSGRNEAFFVAVYKVNYSQSPEKETSTIWQVIGLKWRRQSGLLAVR